jgi:hypothetical protein
MSKTHISNFGSFGESLRHFADPQGFIEYTDFYPLVKEMTIAELTTLRCDDSGDYAEDEKAAAAVELASRAIDRWRAAQ